jgi:lipid A ethanolaminephosphotransferase
MMNFSNVSSCGTSTAYSVPCMFSLLGKDDYSPQKADNQSNVLDILHKAGVKVFWLDNNSSCKGVCNRIENKNIFSQGKFDISVLII